jgi:hypothetical protein
MEENKRQKEINKNICYNCGLTVDLNERDYPVCEECSNENFEGITNFVKAVEETIPDMNRITDKIYLGSNIVAEKRDFLQDYGIDEIVICSHKLKPLYPNDFKYYSLFRNEYIENFDLVEFLDDCYSFIDDCKKVLVYCESGNSLSAAVVLGYLIFKCDYSFEKAFEVIRSSRKGVLPTDIYVQQIKGITKELNEDN